MKKRLSFGSIFWGIVLILCAVLIIVDSVGASFGFLDGIPVIRIIIGVLLAAWVVADVVKLNFHRIFFPLAFIFILFEERIAAWAGIEDGNIISHWLVLLCAALLSAGVGILMSGNRKSKRGFSFTFDSDGSKSSSGGPSMIYIDCAGFTYQEVESSLGKCDVYFSNTDMYTGGGVLEVDNSLGLMVIHLPADWSVKCAVDNSLGAVEVPPAPPSPRATLTVTGDNSLGKLEITY